MLSEKTKTSLGKNADDDSPIKTLRTVLSLVIDRVFLSQFTWTGKTKPKTARKIAFRDQKKLQDILLKVVSKFHLNYDQSKMENHLINKILSGAYV